MADVLMTARRPEATAAADFAKLLLRLIVGLLVLLHGIDKIKGGPAEILDVVVKAGLPGAFGYLVYLGEIVAPLFLVIGLWTRLAAIIVAIDLLVAILLVHPEQFLQLNETGGWALELQGMYLVVALAIALLGAGRYSFGGTRGRWN